MKLLIVSRPFIFHGGVETATAGLVGALVEHGHEVHLLSPPGQQPMLGVTRHVLRLPPLPPTARLVGQAIAARLVMRRRSWDVVQSHERTVGQDLYRAGEGCHRGYLAAVGEPGRPLYHRVVLALERRVFASSRHVVAIAEAGRQEIAQSYGVEPTRLSVVYNGVDLVRFHPDNTRRYRDPTRASVALPSGAWVVLFIGSGFSRKGLATAIEGFAAFRDPDSRLLVIGKGDTTPYRALAARLGVQTHVLWLGPRSDAERWYAAADVVLLPSRYEPFGNVHLEALASGRPVVASRRAGGAEVVEDGVSGVHVDPAKPGEVTSALERLRALPAAALTERARQAAEPFTYAAQVAGFMRIYTPLVAAKYDSS